MATKWFVYLLLVLMHSLWIDGLDARQHDEQINQAGHHRRGIGGGSSYEIYARNNNDKNRESGGGGGGGHRNSFGGNDSGKNGNGEGHKRGERHGHRRGHRKQNRSYNPDDNISLWINEQQLKMLTGNVWQHFRPHSEGTHIILFP